MMMGHDDGRETATLEQAARAMAQKIDYWSTQLARLLLASQQVDATDPDGITLDEIAIGAPLAVVLDEADNLLAIGRQLGDGRTQALGAWSVSSLRMTEERVVNRAH